MTEEVKADSSEGTSPTASPQKNGNDHSSRELDEKIIEQVEYYFGDINLPRDRFLQGELKKDDGWVELSTMLRFKRLAGICSDPEIIAAALLNSKLMQVSEDRSKIRRDPDLPLPENSLEHWQTVKHRTVYVKGFPLDATLDDVQSFFKQFGIIENIVMRRERSGTKAFKGSVFATFKDRETAKTFVNNDTKQYKGSDIIKMLQEDYWTSKQQRTRERKAADKNAKLGKKVAEISEQNKSYATTHFVKGLVLAVEGLPKEGVDIIKMKEFFNKFGTVGYVALQLDEQKAKIRFAGEEGGAGKAWEAAVAAADDGKVIFLGSEIKAHVLDGDEETEYWNDFNASKAKKSQNQNMGRRGRGRGRGQGNRGGRQKHESGQKRPNENGKEEAKEQGDSSPPKKPKLTVFNDDGNSEPSAE